MTHVRQELTLRTIGCFGFFFLLLNGFVRFDQQTSLSQQQRVNVEQRKAPIVIHCERLINRSRRTA